MVKQRFEKSTVIHEIRIWMLFRLVTEYYSVCRWGRRRIEATGTPARALWWPESKFGGREKRGEEDLESAEVRGL